MTETLSELPTDVAGVFRAAFAGSVVVPSDPGYEEARRVWNGTVDCRPAADYGTVCGPPQTATLPLGVSPWLVGLRKGRR